MLLPEFLKSFFDKNPLSSLCITGMYHGKCFKISSFSKNIKTHTSALRNIDYESSGIISLQNALELAINLHKNSPLYSNKEILVISSSIST